MRIIAADDEPLALDELTKVLKEVRPHDEILSFVNPNHMLVYAKTHPCDIAFLDIQMGSMSGIEAAKRLKEQKPDINIIFVTGYDEYAVSAMKLHPSGFLMKPYTKEEVAVEFEELRHPVVEEGLLTARCFGNFDIFFRGESIEFERKKTKELLAYLIDRRGNTVTAGQIQAVLWDGNHLEQNTNAYLQKLKKDLISTMKKLGIKDFLQFSWNKYAIDPAQLQCDYYDYLDDKPDGVRAYNGEYMSQYSWGEVQNVLLRDRKEK